MNRLNPEALSSGAAMIDLDRMLDEHIITPRILVIVFLCFAVMLVDGFDLFVTSQLLPSIAQSYHTTTAILSGSYSAQIVGQALGAFAIGPLADRFGRRPAFLASLGLFGLANLSSVLCVDATQFGVSRFFCGALGGGLTPIIISLVADIAPRRWRGRLIGLTYVGLFIGPLGSAGVTGWLLNLYGWRSAFWIGGCAALLLWPVILSVVPESPRYLARRNPLDPKISRALKRLGIDGMGTSFSTEAASRDAPVIGLFRDGRAPMTLTLWLLSSFSLIAGTLFGLLGTFYHEFAGVPLASFAGFLTLMLAGSAFAVVLVGAVMDKIGTYRTLFALAAAGALSVVSLTALKIGTVPFSFAIFCSGFCFAGAQQALNIVVPLLYPATMRATAIGWKAGLSRLASAAAPLLGGAVLASHAGLGVALLITATPLVILALGTPLLAIAARRGAART